MSEYLKLGRVYFVLLAILTAGRFVMGNYSRVPFEKGTDKMSIVIVTIVATLLYAAFARAFLGYKMWDAAKLTMTLGLVSQVVIVLATAAVLPRGHRVVLQPPPGAQPAAGGGIRPGPGHPGGRPRGQHPLLWHHGGPGLGPGRAPPRPAGRPPR